MYLLLCSLIYWYIIINIRTPSCILGVINYCLYLLLRIHMNPVVLLLLILPTEYNKSVKAPLNFTSDVWKTTVLGVGSCANTALSFTSCCICHSTPPLVLYFLYVTHNGPLTCTYNSYSSNQEEHHVTHLLAIVVPK